MKQTILNSKAFSKTRKEIESAYPYIIEQGYEKELKKVGFNLSLQWKFLWSSHITMGDFFNILRNNFPNIVTIMFIYKLYPTIYNKCKQDDFYYSVSGMKKGEFTIRAQAVFLGKVINLGEIEVDI